MTWAPNHRCACRRVFLQTCRSEFQCFSSKAVAALSWIQGRLQYKISGTGSSASSPDFLPPPPYTQNSRELTSALPVPVKALRAAGQFEFMASTFKCSWEAAQTRGSWWQHSPKISSTAELCFEPAREAAPSPQANMINKGDTLSDIHTISTVKLIVMTVGINQRQKTWPLCNFATITK